MKDYLTRPYSTLMFAVLFVCMFLSWCYASSTALCGPGGNNPGIGGPGGGGPGAGYNGGGMMGGGMMGGGMGMNQFRVADLDGDTVPEIVQIFAGSYLVILDNEGNAISSNLLPVLPTQTNQYMVRAAGLDVADIDGDDNPEIITEYRGPSGVYLVILDHQGNLKSYKQLTLPFNQVTQ
jgi:hypothetical protein